ncbi:MAG: hypothetical protein HQL91_13840 [Magnetococcales bacterium]|nr:hypothetical protein [Magnetococcales bacterium]
MNFIAKRFLEPSTWASLAACAAIVTGHDPATTANTTLQVVGGLASLLGVFMAENNTPPRAG